MKPRYRTCSCNGCTFLFHFCSQKLGGMAITWVIWNQFFFCNIFLDELTNATSAKQIVFYEYTSAQVLVIITRATVWAGQAGLLLTEQDKVFFGTILHVWYLGRLRTLGNCVHVNHAPSVYKPSGDHRPSFQSSSQRLLGDIHWCQYAVVTPEFGLERATPRGVEGLEHTGVTFLPRATTSALERSISIDTLYLLLHVLYTHSMSAIKLACFVTFIFLKESSYRTIDEQIFC